MAQGDVYKLAVVGTFGLGQQFVCTIHYRQDNVVVGNGAEVLAGMFNDNVVVGFSQLMSANDIINTIEVRHVPGFGTEGFDLPVDVQGSRAGDALPAQVCPLISWRTGQIGRRNRGRMYLPAPVENDQVAGQLSQTYLDAMQNVADSMISLNILVDTIFQAVVYGAPTTTPPPGLPENIVDITTAICRQDLATQRRRRVGTGS